MSGAKAEDPEDDGSSGGGYHFEAMLLFYTVFIVAMTSFIWWFLSRSEGPDEPEMSSTRRFNRRTLLGTYDEEDDQGSEEDEYGNVHDVPRPRGLPGDRLKHVDPKPCGTS